MTLSCSRTIKYLQNQCSNLHLDVTASNGKKIMKSDYINALRSHFIKEKFPMGIPKSLEYSLQLDSPMLCSRFNELKDDDKEAIWVDNDWIAEEKIDGVRMLIIYADGVLDFYSRNLSDKDYLPISYQGNVLCDKIPEYLGLGDFILDCEIISKENSVSTIMGNRGVITETQLQAIAALLSLNGEDSLSIQKNYKDSTGKNLIEFKCFDCLMYDGKWVLDNILDVRKSYVFDLVSKLDSYFPISLPMSCISNKKQFYKSIVAAGGEGIVLKCLDGIYRTDGNRPTYKSKGFIKVKRTMSEACNLEGISDTVDAFVTGFEVASSDKRNAGLVGTLIFSIILEEADGSERVHEFAHIAGFTDAERQEFTDFDSNGNPILNKSFYGRVAEIDGQCVSSRTLHLRHARLVRWRFDRSMNTCKQPLSFIESLVL